MSEGKAENSNDAFSVRALLREREALLIHFSTPMRDDKTLLFPADLQNAMGLSNMSLAFCTIQVGDRGPTQTDPQLANSCGSVGIVVDIEGIGCVLAVGSGDNGSREDRESGELGSMGNAPDPDSCARSIDERRTMNEWRVKNYRTIGLFIFEPTRVDAVCEIPDWDGTMIATTGEVDVPLDKVLAAFPDKRVFGMGGGSFKELDRATGAWSPVTYDEIVTGGQ